MQLGNEGPDYSLPQENIGEASSLALHFPGCGLFGITVLLLSRHFIGGSYNDRIGPQGQDRLGQILPTQVGKFCQALSNGREIEK